MLTEKELEKVINLIMKRFDDVNTFFIRKVAVQLKKIGELNQTSINRLIIMAEMNSDVDAITRMLVAATNLTIPDIQKVYEMAMEDVYTDQRFTRAFQAGSKVPPDVIKANLRQYANSVAAQTAQTITNLSNTTAIADTYRKAIDRGILAVSSGLDSYSAATRSVVRELGYNGMQVHYASGYHRRLDTAVRQNIIDGTNQIAQNGANIVGEALEYDAVEISAHMYSAPDHEPVQGRVFSKAEFANMQSGMSCKDVNGNVYGGFRRRIAEWNCQHFALPFSTVHSTPRYTEAQLQDWAAQNAAGCDVDGKHYTTYQASQLMRKIETEVRRWKDTANAARLVNDDVLRRQCQMNINALSAQYQKLCAASGLPSEKQRMSVEGFRMVKV